MDGDPAPRGGTTSPGAVPTGSSTVAPAGIVACLRLAARIASRSRFGQRVISGLTISAIRSESASSSTISRPWNLPTTSAVEVVCGGAQPAARQDDAHPLLGHEPQRRLHVLRAIAHDRRVGEVHAELAQPLGQPRTVAVAHPAAEHLGAGDDYSRARAHVQVGSWPACSDWRPVAFVIEYPIA